MGVLRSGSGGVGGGWGGGDRAPALEKERRMEVIRGSISGSLAGGDVGRGGAVDGIRVRGIGSSSGGGAVTA